MPELSDKYQIGPPQLRAVNWKNFPLVTAIILLINLVLYGVTRILGSGSDIHVLLDLGAMFTPRVAEGEYWRLATAVFLHANASHLLLNGLALFMFGRLAEKTFGHMGFAFIYMLSGLYGSMLSFLMHSIAIGVGASGAIFGILGALGSYFLVQRNTPGAKAWFNLAIVVLMAGVSLGYGLITPHIDNWAHLGGLIGGSMLGIVLSPRPDPHTKITENPVKFKYPTITVTRSLVILFLIAVLFIGSLAGVTRLPDNGYTRLFKAQEYIAEGNHSDALIELNKALELERSLSDAYYLRGVILAEQGHIPDAISELGYAVRYGQFTNSETRAKAIKLMLELRK